LTNYQYIELYSFMIAVLFGALALLDEN